MRMNTLKLKNKYQTNATLISNNFIDYYMSKANGEYVKVYLFLLRHLDHPDYTLTISSIADFLDNTERDVIRAFRYWENEGLLTLERDAQGRIVGLSLEQVCTDSSCSHTDSVSTVMNEPISATSYEEADESPNLEQSSPSPAETMPAESVIAPTAVPDHARSAQAQKELKSLLFIAEQYLGKTLTKTDMDAIAYFYDSLEMSADLIEYLIESCVEGGHNSIHYIQSVAMNWYKAGIHTKEEAKQQAKAYNKNYYSVLNAFGIKNRTVADAEAMMIQKWLQEYHFSLEVILEACNRTIAKTHQPSFEYADSILYNWFTKHVTTLDDITALDTVFHQEKKVKKVTVTPHQNASSKNMNNFERRSYDMDSLEARLLNSN